MPRARLTRETKKDLKEIWTYIADQNVEAAERVNRILYKSFDRLAESPRLGRQRPELGEKIRSIPEGNYVIFYKPLKDGVMVLRVIHGARDLKGLF